jgi:hypothetical protein
MEGKYLRVLKFECSTQLIKVILVLKDTYPITINTVTDFKIKSSIVFLQNKKIQDPKHF